MTFVVKSLVNCIFFMVASLFLWFPSRDISCAKGRAEVFPLTLFICATPFSFHFAPNFMKMQGTFLPKNVRGRQSWPGYESASTDRLDKPEASNTD
jgi:hypothetical protein